ncbi:hypothetical protein C8R45DRAFT_931632 [Mycena sanguinolenta]|nr:hypothetical protein C8R45DRAFT_931632 [Mycena sanguinolenta]
MPEPGIPEASLCEHVASTPSVQDSDHFLATGDSVIKVEKTSVEQSGMGANQGDTGTESKVLTLSVPVKVDEDADPEALLVRRWRHDLQKMFLHPQKPPNVEDMPTMDALFTTVELWDMKLKYLRYSKIGIVMRHIQLLDTAKVPRDDEFQFRNRAKALVERWTALLAVRAPACVAAHEPGDDGTLAGVDGPGETETPEGNTEEDVGRRTTTPDLNGTDASNS